MSLTMGKDSKSIDLLACRTCLATDRKLYSIHEYNLLEAYRFLIGNNASHRDCLPQYLCTYCATLLLKFNSFKKNSELAQEYLEDDKFIQSTLTTKYQISLKRSATKIIDITQNEIFELKSDYYDKINSHDFDYSDNIQSQDSKIFTDLNKKEFTITETPNKSQIKDLPSRTKASNSKSNKNLKKEDSKSTQNLRKKGKYFETDENMRDFEIDYNVKVIVLSPEQQMEDILNRKLSSNYIQSPYKCELCFKGMMDAESLKKHVLYQHDPSKGSIICQYCSFRYKDKRGLNQHLKSHRLKFACKQCSYVSRTTFNAKEHFKMHTGHTHKCRHCEKSYEKLSSHLTHLRIQHPSDFIWCDVCGEAFIGQFGLNAHKKRAHRHLNLPFSCVSCEASFVSETALTKHSSYAHCCPIKCVHCGDSFNKDMELRDHLLEKHRILKVSECEKCHKGFSRQSLLWAHYRRAHVDSKDKRKVTRPWVCEVCGKTMPNKSVLLYHQRNHTGERPYQCTQCDKSFTMKKLLQSHLRVHTSDRPYACKLCPKAFKGLSALRTHRHIHSVGEKKSSSNQNI